MAIAYAWSSSAQQNTTDVTSLQIDISGATTDEWVYCFLTKTKSGGTTLNGWDLVLSGDQNTNYHFALYRRRKQSGDTTFTTSWSTSCRALACLIQWTGLDATVPDERAIAQFHTSGDTWATASATPNGGSRWAATFTSYRTTNIADNNPSWTSTGLTQRQDLDTSAGLTPWLVALTTDTNAAVTEAAHDYTHIASATNSSGVSVLMFLVAGGLNGSVAAVEATATAAALAPTVTGGATVAAAAATATAFMGEPSIVGEASGSPTVSVPTMTADAQAEAPAVTTSAFIDVAVATATAQAHAPFAGVVVLIFSPPTRREHYGTKQRDPLGVRIGYPTGQTVLKQDGFYTTYLLNDVSDELIAAADAAYVGGRDYVISTEEAADLTSAGYGSYITSRAQ